MEDRFVWTSVYRSAGTTFAFTFFSYEKVLSSSSLTDILTVSFSKRVVVPVNFKIRTSHEFLYCHFFAACIVCDIINH